jgi:hypothetical protein
MAQKDFIDMNSEQFRKTYQEHSLENLNRWSLTKTEKIKRNTVKTKPRINKPSM